MAKEVGCSPNEWGDYENGKRPQWHRLEGICVRWSVNPAWIMWGVEPKTLDFKKGIELRWAKEKFERMIDEAPQINEKIVAQGKSLLPDLLKRYTAAELDKSLNLIAQSLANTMSARSLKENAPRSTEEEADARLKDVARGPGVGEILPKDDTVSAKEVQKKNRRNIKPRALKKGQR